MRAGAMVTSAFPAFGWMRPGKFPMHKLLIGLAATSLLAGCASDQSCLKLNKTSGTVVGAVGGGLIGNAIFGSTLGTLGGAAAGGLAGHELSRNGRKRCR